MPGIVWLASYPKSGNTWLRAFLANYLADRPTPVPINDLPKFCLGDGTVSLYCQYSGLKPGDLDYRKVAELRPRVHLWMARSSPNNVFVKTHAAIAIHEGKPLITPEATVGALYVIRNPFDVAVSSAHHYQVTLERAVEILCTPDYKLPPQGDHLEELLGSWDQHIRSWTTAPGLRLHVMRYEDMRAAPLREFGRMLKFLQVPPDMARLKRAVAHASFDELKKQETQNGFVEARPDGTARFFREGKSGDWRHHFTPELTEKLRQAFEPTLRQWGYLDREGRIAA